jgi:heme-degrading monooxygenase HmoA
MDQSPVLLHIWNVDPEAEATLVEKLGEMLRHVSDDPGLVSARVLASPDRRSVAALIEMRSAEDRERLQALPEVRETLNSVQDDAYNLIITLYHEVGRVP